MLQVFFLLTSFIFITLVIYCILSLIYKEKYAIQRRIGELEADIIQVTTYQQKNKGKMIEKGSFFVRIFQPMFIRIRENMFKKMSEQNEAMITKRLKDAGSPFRLQAVDFRLVQIGLSIVFFLLFVFMFLPSAESVGSVLIFGIIASLFGLFYPEYYLKLKKQQRVDAIQKEMPDFFDMVGVTIEAGMGLDAALNKVSKQMKSPLSDEFLRTLDDMKLGMSKRDAFSELRDRVPSEQFQSVINSLIQADQLGIAMSKVLRAQTKRIREQRRQQAKEKAMKAPIKMMIPMVLFIFPTLFIILLGPVILQLMINFF
ncbi:hypothetical protein BKP35_01280 [Anaerobacillus arseniciselenatis]|uniref:Type II secretion system protein GspF domain-containing protein n=1 Tax=Anaerobacillus arseniciselenatis TaxID=85682 RepID=A0A1S2LTG6_9BACI|nr:type II secretion system F family protein [Anaerobacillus arseniciselenatis]OIJ15656.1 hypothetical protein BKP35_01280 [Anaerobacillus arseniciselenatis]